VKRVVCRSKINNMTLWLYSLVMRLAQPFLRARLKQRGVAEPGYLVAVNERFGQYADMDAAAPDQAAPGNAGFDDRVSGFIWIHAVSLGETVAAAGLIAQLRQRLPVMRLLLTHGTATGRAEGERLLQTGDVQAWAPWDAPKAVNAFLARFKPQIGILMETEVWPNMVAACKNRAIPLVLANARLSHKSLQDAKKLAWLSRPAYQNLAAVWAQTQADADRFTQLGVVVQGVFGNLKFDATPDATLLEQGRSWHRVWYQSSGKPVVMFASSRAGEELAFLRVLHANLEEIIATSRIQQAQTAIKNIANLKLTEVQWLIVPRHPQRFDEVAALISQQGFNVSRRSAWVDRPPPHNAVAQSQNATADPAPVRNNQSDRPTIWLGDSLGEMPLYYALADVALLGGSFELLGGQNLIEAAACGCPVVMGPHTFNFADAADLAQVAGAAIRVEDMASGIATAGQLVHDDSRLQNAQTASVKFAKNHQGATEKLADAICLVLAKQ
jgi:3-deoxy-D-manno-octulosonic-acid transferase